jgi:peptidoglycan hydrolase CwlO-like protein
MSFELLFEAERKENIVLHKVLAQQSKEIETYKIIEVSKNNSIDDLKNKIEELSKNINNVNAECTEMISRIKKFNDTKHISIGKYE